MANQPRKDNPARTVRVEDDLWNDSNECAAWNDESVSQVVRRDLRAYVRKTRAAQAKAAEEARAAKATVKGARTR